MLHLVSGGQGGGREPMMHGLPPTTHTQVSARPWQQNPPCVEVLGEWFTVCHLEGLVSSHCGLLGQS